MRNIVGSVVLTMLLFACGSYALAQDDWLQSQACPAWNNPANFSVTGNNGSDYWTGKNGCVPGSPMLLYNASTGETGVNWSTTEWDGSQLATKQASGNCSGSTYGTIPSHEKFFKIMSSTDQAPGHPVNMDPNTGDHLRFVPTQYNTTDQTYNTQLTKSIRIGDDCPAGSSSNNDGATALYYYCTPTPDNALMFIYYACVIEAPGHGRRGDPKFIIRVMKQNATGQWVQIDYNHLSYYISSAPTNLNDIDASERQYGVGDAQIVPWGQGGPGAWHQHGSGYNAVIYKDWTKVAINLSDYMYKRLRIEVMTHDCIWNAHYAYAYIAGECRQMALSPSGCPPGESEDVTTITAPTGMQAYEWSASEFGKTNNPDYDFMLPDENDPDGGMSHYFTFRVLADSTQATYQYNVQTSDFRVFYRPNANHLQIPIGRDSIGNIQTFRCRMKSALNPAYPFWSQIYLNVQNTKPTMKIDTLAMCGGDVKMKNASFVPGDPSLVVDSLTKWSVYSNTLCSGIPDTVMVGDSVMYHTDARGLRGLLVRTNTTDTGCYSEKRYIIRPKLNPKVGMTISDRELCDTATTRLADTTSDGLSREWIFLRPDDSTGTTFDTIRGEGSENQIINRAFTHGVEPIVLRVYNGQSYINPLMTTERIYCYGVAHDTVAVFLHPELEVTGDTIVCKGSKTEAVVRTIGVDSCTFEWSRSYGSITGSIPEGDTLRVEPYADTSTYYVRVTSKKGCVAWDSIRAYLVSPKLRIFPADGRICPGDSAMLVGQDATYYTWSGSPADSNLPASSYILDTILITRDSTIMTIDTIVLVDLDSIVYDTTMIDTTIIVSYSIDSIWSTLDTIYVHPDTTTIYTMVGHGMNNCDADPLTQQVTVVPLPVLRVSANPSVVDCDDPTVTLRDISPNSIASTWLFNNSELVEGREVTHTFEEAMGAQGDSVHVLLTSYNELNCPKEYNFAIPVYLFTSWFPNAFTPGSNDDNSKFKLFTNNPYEYFHIYIYDRRGMLVFESTDPQFEWDGTLNGVLCPQGAYVYICSYRKPGVNTLKSLKGTITLVR